MRALKLFGVSATAGLLVLVAGSFGQVECTVTITPEQSIQQAIDAASEGAVICLSAGTWEENIEIKKSLTLRGAGRKQTILKGSKIISGSVIRIIGVSKLGIDVTIESLTVTEGRYGGIEAGGEAFIMLQDIQASHNGLSGIQVGGLVKMVLTGSHISHNFRGLTVGHGPEVTVWENSFEDNTECGIFAYTDENAISGIANKMWGNGADLCGFAPVFLREPLVPETDKMEITVPGDFQDLQDAVDAVAPGGTIHIAPGRYRTSLTLWKPVKLRGAGRELTVLQGWSDRQKLISIPAWVYGVELEDLTVTGGQDEGLLVYGQVHLRRVIVFGNHQDGINVHGPAKLVLTESQVSHNRRGIWGGGSINLINSQVFGNEEAGIGMGGSATTIVLVNSMVSWNGYEGIDLGEESVRGILIRSQISHNGYSGVIAYGEAIVTVVKSEISHNGTQRECQSPGASTHTTCNGLTLLGEASAFIEDSSFVGNTDWGIATWLRQCGYERDELVSLISLEGGNFEGNNRSNNHTGQGNPGDHSFKALPDGQVCLP